MNSSGQVSPSLSSTSGNDVNSMPKNAIQAELRSYLGTRCAGPGTSNDVHADDSWRERRASLWRRLDYLREIEGMFGGR